MNGPTKNPLNLEKEKVIVLTRLVNKLLFGGVAIIQWRTEGRMGRVAPGACFQLLVS